MSTRRLLNRSSCARSCTVGVHDHVDVHVDLRPRDVRLIGVEREGDLVSVWVDGGPDELVGVLDAVLDHVGARREELRLYRLGIRRCVVSEGEDAVPALAAMLGRGVELALEVPTGDGRLFVLPDVDGDNADIVVPASSPGARGVVRGIAERCWSTLLADPPDGGTPVARRELSP